MQSCVSPRHRGKDPSFAREGRTAVHRQEVVEHEHVALFPRKAHRARVERIEEVIEVRATDRRSIGVKDFVELRIP